MKIIYLYLILCLYSLNLCSQDDEFNDVCTTLSWNRINETEGWNADQLEIFDIGISAPGGMTLIPYTSSWFADYRGVLVYKEIPGNFVFTSKVIVTNRAGDAIPDASSQYSLGGLMIRNADTLTTGATGWAIGQQNYIFLSMGYAATNHPSCSGCPAPHFEVKSTINSHSSLQVSSIDTTAAELRFARIDHAMIVLYRFPGQNWTVHQRYNRSDFGDTLQVGMCAYTDWNKVNTYSYLNHNAYILNNPAFPIPDNNPGQPFNPDIRAVYEYARFDQVTVPPPLAGLNLLNPAEVSDNDLLTFLGYASIPDTVLIGNKWTGIVSAQWHTAGNWSQGIPASSDTARILDCSCPTANCPIVSTDQTIHSLEVHRNGTLTIATGATLTIQGDGSGLSPYFKNEGTILVDGILHIINVDQELINKSFIECRAGGEIIVE